jgi:hypothetical protein
MGGGRAILTFPSTRAIVEIGTTITNAKSNVPRNNFFILFPLIHLIVCLPFVSLLTFPASHNQQHDAADERNSPHNGWQRQRFSFLSRHLDGAEIDGFFLGDARVSERRDSQSDQCDRT